MCRYTIITVCKNAEYEIDKTIESVLLQKISPELIEYIIIDGLSVDKTLNIIEKYKGKFKEKRIAFRVYSESDNGIYDAMNKGTKLARGKWCIYLNAGDVFFDEMALKYVDDIAVDDYDIIYGDTILSYNTKYKIEKAKDQNNINFINGMEFCHQSSLIKTSFLLENPYTEKYRISSDYDLFVKAYVQRKKFFHINKCIAIFDCNGVSVKKGAEREKEHNEIKYKYGLIGEDAFKKIQKKYNIKIKIKKMIPKRIVEYRSKKIMDKKTKKWLGYNNICKYEGK